MKNTMRRIGPGSRIGGRMRVQFAWWGAWQSAGFRLLPGPALGRGADGGRFRGAPDPDPQVLGWARREFALLSAGGFSARPD